MPTPGSSERVDSDADWGYGGPEPCSSEMEGRAKAVRRRRKDSTSAEAPSRRSKRLLDPKALCNTSGSPSDPHDLGARTGAIGDNGQSTASPIDMCSLSPSLADGALADEGTLTRSSSSSSSRLDFGPFSALRPFDDADPRELAGKGWDSDADWGYVGPEPCSSDVAGRDQAKQRRRKDAASDTAPFRRSKRRRDHRALGSTLGLPSDSQDLGVREGAIGEDRQSTASPIDARSLFPIPADGAPGGRKRPLPTSDSLPEGGHQPGASQLHQGRSLPGKRGRQPRACRQEANEVGLLWRTVDPSLLDDTTLTGDTSLSLAQVVLCLRRMLTMVPSGHAHDAANSLPWHTDWLSILYQG